MNDLLKSSWFTVPPFLWEKDIPPAAEVKTEIQIGDPEVKRVQTLDTQMKEHVSLSDRLSKFSSWSKAIQAIARLLRRAREDKSPHHSTVQEREDARLIIIKDLQRQAYPEEVKLLKKAAQLSPRSKLFHLDPFLDEVGLMKVGGRLKNTSMSTSLKHPTIIQRDHPITRAIIADAHEKICHSEKGRQLTRSDGFWIPGVHRAVASHLHRCITCRKLRRTTGEQRMADLPPERTNPAPPFTYTGMDCFGPFLVKQGRKEYKRYGLLLTCLCCRAVHIEMLDDLSTDSFINSFRCFIAI